MRRVPSTFRQGDVKRALQAIEAAGQKAIAIEIEDGRIKIKLYNSADADDHEANQDVNEWDAQ
ncbi:hypothetical protein [Bradyrhizobium sp. JYMT SZCCT0428]|uniref:hypothetical protein n=1 Tax=Bradyrhizobium sp. JYMT SZCCT0428 TaxID=2807673 RepID=UPI001BAD44C2|nr:hypothetical protein [Bradyrhizobium sp. JYMT SZCCT0428]MBR1153258.1 hypothetical protein [Bradyrhizobium sp. JYMT SZCCT0428]